MTNSQEKGSQAQSNFIRITQSRYFPQIFLNFVNVAIIHSAFVIIFILNNTKRHGQSQLEKLTLIKRRFEDPVKPFTWSFLQK